MSRRDTTIFESASGDRSGSGSGGGGDLIWSFLEITERVEYVGKDASYIRKDTHQFGFYSSLQLNHISNVFLKYLVMLNFNSKWWIKPERSDGW